jgi:hypothetical protein
LRSKKLVGQRSQDQHIKWLIARLMPSRCPIKVRGFFVKVFSHATGRVNGVEELANIFLEVKTEYDSASFKVSQHTAQGALRSATEFPRMGPEPGRTAATAGLGYQKWAPQTRSSDRSCWRRPEAKAPIKQARIGRQAAVPCARSVAFATLSAAGLWPATSTCEVLQRRATQEHIQ